MRLTPAERDRLLVFAAAELARARRARGLRLNAPEATALIADTVAEAARDGLRLADAIERGRSVLGPGDVLEGVVELVDEVCVEATFDDGTRLAVVSDPFRAATPPGGSRRDDSLHDGRLAPGAVLEAARETARRVDAVVEVTNESRVPISVSSHFHFFEANPRLRFSRALAYGRHLAVEAGTTVRFDPGATVSVELADIQGARVAYGFAGLVDGPLDAPGAKERALEKARICGYLDRDP
jgi:urease subunit gamma/beta